jgi:hypothetical protein
MPPQSTRLPATRVAPLTCAVSIATWGGLAVMAYGLLSWWGAATAETAVLSWISQFAR